MNKQFNHLQDLQAIIEIETKQKKMVFFCCSYLGCGILFLFAYKLSTESSIFLKASLYICSLLLLCNAVASHYNDRLTLSFRIAGCILACMMVILVYTGGFQQTGLYWVFPFPIVFFVLFGYRIASVFNVSLLVIFALLLFNDGWTLTQYSLVDSTRFIAAFGVTCSLYGIAEYFRFVSQKELSSLSENEHELANTDPLTQLPNRRYIDSKLMQLMCTHSDLYFPVSVIIADLDLFKKVNDQYGHSLGDEVLKHASTIFRLNIRTSDVVARVGGEEFLFVLPNTSSNAAKNIAEKVRVKLAESPFIEGDAVINCTASFGVAEAKTETDFNTALIQADDLLYDSKKTGRNCVN